MERPRDAPEMNYRKILAILFTRRFYGCDVKFHEDETRSLTGIQSRARVIIRDTVGSEKIVGEKVVVVDEADNLVLPVTGYGEYDKQYRGVGTELTLNHVPEMP